MYCQWQALVGILPTQLRRELEGMDWKPVTELRLRLDRQAEIVTDRGCRYLGPPTGREDLEHCINSASRYSPWAAASVAQGYLTLRGGHRMGLCGEAVYRDGTVTGLRHVTSLCIRVAKDIPGIAAGLPTDRSLVILGAPGWGKTTLLRDLIRNLPGQTGVVDQRRELFPEGIAAGAHTDILTGCPRHQAIPMLLRTMGPECIAVDEITQPEDCEAIVHAANCGVTLLATAHAASLEDFYRRSVYAPLLRHRIFQIAAVLTKDRSCRLERME